MRLCHGVLANDRADAAASDESARRNGNHGASSNGHCNADCYPNSLARRYNSSHRDRYSLAYGRQHTDSGSTVAYADPRANSRTATYLHSGTDSLADCNCCSHSNDGRDSRTTAD